MPSLRRAAACCAVLVLPLAGCTLDPYGTASASPSSPTASASSASASTAPTRTASPVSETTTPVTETSAGTGEPTATTPTTPTTGVEDATVPFPSGSTSETGEGTGPDVGTMADLRLGAHDTFDRVVIQLDGPDIPGWDVGYVDHAIGDPSGAAVDVAGDAVLQVLIHPVAYPEDGTNPYAGPPTVRISGTEAIDEVVMSSIFEGQLQAFIGVRGGHRSFRVYGMSDPSRVVIEVVRSTG
jgi:hypothetical protein